MEHEFGYKQGFLSAQYNNFACKMNNERGHEARKAWLTTHFGDLQHTATEEEIETVLPRAFALTSVSSLLAPPFNINDRLKVTLQRMQVSGQSIEETVRKLYEAVQQTITKDGEICLFMPKRRQTPDMVVSGKEYICIKRNDKLHNHNSSKLLDFVGIEKSRLTGGIIRLPYKHGHTHLIDPALL